MTARRFLMVGVVGIGVAVLGGACGLFKIRDPETPIIVTPVPWQIPTDWHLVLVNLKASTDMRSVTNFDREFTADYVFRFDPFHASGADTTWNRDRDIPALTLLFQGKGPTTLTWTPTDSGTIGADGFYRNLGYRLVIQRSTSDTSHVVIVGLCNLYMTLQGTNWMIRRWEDLNLEDNQQSWGWARLNPGLPH